MANKLTNINEAKFKADTSRRGEQWWELDLSGEHLGVRVEVLSAGRFFELSPLSHGRRRACPCSGGDSDARAR